MTLCRVSGMEETISSAAWRKAMQGTLAREKKRKVAIGPHQLAYFGLAKWALPWVFLWTCKRVKIGPNT